MKDTYSVSRWALRKALLYKAESFVRSGKSFQRYENMTDGSLKIFFDDGTTDECDLLVGADGVGSKVRSQLFPSAKVTEVDIGVI